MSAGEYMMQVSFDGFPFAYHRLSDGSERVDIEGISHLLVHVEDVSEATSDRVPVFLESQRAAEVAAMGVIFVQPAGDKWTIIPFVHVPAVNSLVSPVFLSMSIRRHLSASNPGTAWAR